MKELPLSKDKVALVDDDDYWLASQFKWSALVTYSRVDHRILNIYAHRRPWRDGKQCCDLLHRFLLGITDRLVYVDHVDHDGLNCQRYNLRIATPTQNSHNSRKRINTSSIFKGVTWDSARNKWAARLKVEGKVVNLGRFISENEAAEAYKVAARRFFGEFAYADCRS
jgi:hypothetical protein